MPLPEPINRIRRKTAQWCDQGWVKLQQQFGRPHTTQPFDGDPRFALLTVNYSSTNYLKLMLASLADQDRLDLLKKIIICENGDTDGGKAFLRKLAASVNRIELVEKRYWTNHAAGMRAAVSKLASLDQEASRPANILLFCDPDVVFINAHTLTKLNEAFTDVDTAFAGELRHHLYPEPEAQASFLAVRRDWLHRPGISSWVNHGSPAWWMQRDMQRQAGKPKDFRNNEWEYALHRGRGSVEASRLNAPLSSYASVPNHQAHYMGVEQGAEVWNRTAAKYANLMSLDAESELIGHLRQKFD